MKKQILPLLLLLGATGLSAQVSFSKKTNLLTPGLHFSGVAIAVLDMNGDGLDDIVRMNQGHQLAVEYQTLPNQPFTHFPVGNVSNESQWGMCAADVDNNGFCDVLTGGDYDGIKIVKSGPDGSFFDIIGLDDSDPGTFVQGVNFADINNDGWLDAFVCHDDGVSRIFGNDGAGNLAYQPLWMNLATVPASDNSGNYGSVWSDIDNDGDLDLYIAHCRQGVDDPTDPTRINQLFLNDGNGTYTQDVTNASGLRIGAQSWTADFGDIDNDGDFDCFITNHDVSSQLLENDGFGHFTDISVSSGIFNNVTGTPIQGIFRDFDNDGWVDILVAGSDHALFHNNGNKTFAKLTNPFDNNEMESFAVGDLNNDGFQDIYGGYAKLFTNPSTISDVLWMNQGNNNKFLGFRLRGVQSNRNAVGAKVVLYSALGKQVREVRAGESYGIMNSMQIHFGMGQTAAVDSVVIYWPSGTVDVLTQPLGLNQYIAVQEGGCIVPQATAFATGASVFCTGDSTVLALGNTFASYLWSNGDTTASTTVKSGGGYSVTVTTAEGCTAVSNTVHIIVDPVEIPTITALSDTVICVGGSVTLTSSPASSYLWSNGETTQEITVSAPAAYTVTTQGLCAAFTSGNLHVTVLDNPPSVVANDTLTTNQQATLTATGDVVQWYDAAVGGNLLFTGNSYTTGPLSASATYWVSNTSVYDQPNAFVGMVNHQGSSFGDPLASGQIIFDCSKPVRLARVKVITDIPALRKIDLRNASGDLLQTKSINIASGTSVLQLDFDLPAENGLSLSTDTDVNLFNLGTNSPRLRRSSQGVAYPYSIPDVLTMTGSNFGPNLYYYFFNWEIDYYGHECTSERVPVTAVVDTTNAASLPEWISALDIYPNPTDGAVTVVLKDFDGNHLNVSVKNAQGDLLQRRIVPGAGQIAFQTDFSAWPKGVYWLELTSEKGVLQRKIVSQ